MTVVGLALLGAIWIYVDASRREMETADMWAVGFFVIFLIIPVVGGITVLAVYISKRDQGGRKPTQHSQR